MTNRCFRLILAALALMLTPATTIAQIGGRQSHQFTLGTRADPNVRKPSGQLNSLNDLAAAVYACWKPPPLEYAHQGMEITLRFAFSRDGKLLGQPQVTYATPEVTLKTREAYREALTRSLEDCTPFPFTRALGGAVAGRPMTARVVDSRDDSRIKPRI
jgi:hypothetical protein